MSRRVFVLSVCTAVLVGAGLIPSAAVATGDGVMNIRLANGIETRVFTSGYLAERTVIDGMRGELYLENGEFITVVTDINDPTIQNKGDGRFHPFPDDVVLDCLAEIEYPGINLKVDVFILPYPRANILSSSASGGRIYLSPQVLEISKEGAAYIVAHELGHVFQYRYLPEQLPDRWNEYKRIRGIANETKFSNSASHAYRPREIFAEDFRVLFGGPAAHFGGRVENPELPSPIVVAGLEDFYLRLATQTGDLPVIVSFGNFPNPFNPQTELRIHLNEDFWATGQRVAVRVYDVTGALVRELYTGRPSAPDIHVMWDGRDKHGRQVASSTYFGVVEAGGARMTTKLLMIK